MAKNEVKMLKINNSNINSEIVKIKNKKNSSYQKDIHISLNIPKPPTKCSSSNHISLLMEEDTKSKSSCLIPRIKQKNKNVTTKKKKKSKILKLKNERLKIPIGKRRSISGQPNNLIINSVKNEIKSLTPPKITKPKNIRRDKYGTEINKINKKKCI